MKMRIADGSTLRTLVPSLKDPIEFVRRALGSMLSCDRYGRLRVALDSNPHAPDYLVEMLVHDIVDEKRSRLVSR